VQRNIAPVTIWWSWEETTMCEGNVALVTLD
jgi:hypothetical protein